jgi:macrolide-specific efflux system membrane fusion protein
MKLKKRHWMIIGGVAFLAVVGILWKKSSENRVIYKKVTVSRGDLQSTILSTGIVQPENRLEIKPPIAGRADQVLVDEGDMVKKGQILLWMSSTERAALLDAARARGPAELKKWEIFYKATPVLAPIDGTIILRSIEPGQTFTGVDAVLVMSDRLTVQAQVDETDIAEIHLKQKAKVLLDAYPDQTIPSEVDKIAYEAKTVNNVTTYIVEALPDKTPDFMRSGMTANVTFLVGSRENVLILPIEAIRVKKGHSTVLLQPAHGGDKETEIQTGLSDGKRVEIISGLSEGDMVLVPQLKTKSTAGVSPFSPYGKAKQQGR